MRVHTGEKPYACTHPGCDYRTSDCSTLARHMRVHTGEKPHVCTWPGCTYSTARSGDLARHRRMHTGEKPHKCAHIGCDYAASRTSHLAEHYRIHHHGEQPPQPKKRAYRGRPNAGAARKKKSKTVDDELANLANTLTALTPRCQPCRSPTGPPPPAPVPRQSLAPEMMGSGFSGPGLANVAAQAKKSSTAVLPPAASTAEEDEDEPSSPPLSPVPAPNGTAAVEPLKLSPTNPLKKLVPAEKLQDLSDSELAAMALMGAGFSAPGDL